MGKLVSIVLPVYNGKKYLSEMLNSIYLQSYRPIQLIIINDNSTDSSKNIIEEFVIKHSKKSCFSIINIDNPINIGLTANINKGFKEVKGEYIFLADHDDIWKKNKINKHLDYMNNNKNVICTISDRSIIDDYGKILCKSEFKLKNNYNELVTYDFFKNRYWIPASNVMCFRNIDKIMKNIFPIPNNIIEHDYYLIMLMSLYGKIWFIQGEPLVKYRIHKNNLSISYWYITEFKYKDYINIVDKKIERNRKVIKDKSIIENKIHNITNKNIELNYSNVETKIRYEKLYKRNIIFYYLWKIKKIMDSRI